jgi:hypothetical protein
MIDAMNRGLRVAPSFRGSPGRLTPFQPSLDPAMALRTAPGNLATGSRIGVEHLAHGILHADSLCSPSGGIPSMAFTPSLDHVLATSPGDEACASRVRVEPLTSGHANIVRSTNAKLQEQIKGLKIKLDVREKENRA